MHTCKCSIATDKGFEWPSHLHTCCLEEEMGYCRVWAKARSQCEAIHKQPLMIRVCIWFQVLPKSSIPPPKECSATVKKQKTWLQQTLQQKTLKKGLKETHTYTYVYLYLNKDTIDCCFVAQFKEHIWCLTYEEKDFRPMRFAVSRL